MSKNIFGNLVRSLSDLKLKSGQFQNNFERNFSSKTQDIRRESSDNLTVKQQKTFSQQTDSANNSHQKLNARLIIARHGQTDLNVQKVWAGQFDAQITETGVEQARNLGRILREQNFIPDVVLTTPLSRASRTAEIALKEMNCSDVKVEKIVALVELSPGDFTKKAKNQENKHFTKTWHIRPPEMDLEHESHPENIGQISSDVFIPMPFGESLSDVANRTFLAYDYVLSLLQQDKKVLVVGHSNSLSTLVSHFSGEKTKIKIPNALPIELILEKRDDKICFLGVKDLSEKSVENQASSVVEGSNSAPATQVFLLSAKAFEEEFEKSAERS